MHACWFCGTECAPDAKVARKDTCSKCRMALKACRNCRFYDPHAPKQCREPAAEHVGDKEGANFCEFFDFAEGAGGAGRPRAPGPDDAKRKFDSLFGKK